MRALLAALAVALLLPAAARAQPVSAVSGPDTYLQLHLGAFLPRANALDGLDTGWDVGGSFGARFTPNLSAEAGVAYYRANGSGLTLADLPITASLRVRAPFKTAELSGFAGVGLHFAQLEANLVGITSPGSSRTSEDVAFGYHVGAAFGLNLSPTMLVGAEAVWTFVEPRLFGQRTKIDGLRLAVTLGYHF
jgi:opacity protein-like surface antigen